LRYHQGGKIQKAKEKLPHPTCLPFAELFATFEAFATFATFATFASLHSYSYSIFSLLKRNKLIEPKIKLNLQICKCANLQMCKCCKRCKMELNKNRDMEHFNLKILDLHNVRYALVG